MIAAIYLDGGYAPAKEFILQYGKLETEIISTNYKGAVQEFLQKKGTELPRYEIEKSGKDNAPMFKATAFAMGITACGEGGSKKEAEQKAAKILLDQLSKK